jgi:CheY-like chemotaxis protein
MGPRACLAQWKDTKRAPSPKVLVVDDEQEVCDVIGEMLQFIGYVALKALDGLEGVALARAELPDLVLMDLRMPRMSGFQAARLLQDDPRTAGIPVVALTAAAHEEVADLMDDHWTGCLQKPIMLASLAAEVTGFLGNVPARV